MSKSRCPLPSSCFLFHGPDLQLDGLGPAIEAEHIEVRPADSLLSRGFASDGPSVLLIDQSLATHAQDFADLANDIVVVAADAAAEDMLGAAADLSLAPLADARGQLVLLRAAFKLSAERRCSSRAYHQLDEAQTQLTELDRLGTALMVERDRPRLIREILAHALRDTTSDTAGIFLMEKEESGEPRLHLRLILSDSLDNVDIAEAPTRAVDSKSVIGYVAQTKQPLVLEDVHNLPPDLDLELDLALVEHLGYWVRSSLSVPLLDHRNEAIGVLQVVNRKTDPKGRIHNREDVDRFVISYSTRDVERTRAMAGQAAVLIENALLYAQIENLFDSFVKACVTAIDQRDPTMKGHSIRVATLTTELATAIERTTTGPYGALRFSAAQMRELRYAALMHDLGKIGVEEDVLVKAKKLPPVLWERVQGRFDVIRATLELEYERRRARLAEADRAQASNPLDVEFSQRRGQIDRFQQAIEAANEPTLLHKKAAAVIDNIAHHTFERVNGRVEPYLAPEELHYLRIHHGSLDDSERREVETHAAETCGILSKIPWTDDLKGIVEYAAGHHEKLNGTGYPNRLTGDRIPVQTRLITIADIFDALTAADRPYKRAISAERALGILESEAKAGLLDPELVRVLIDSEVYRKVLDGDWRQF